MEKAVSSGMNPELFSEKCYVGRIIESILPYMLGEEQICSQHVYTEQEVEGIKRRVDDDDRVKMRRYNLKSD